MYCNIEIVLQAVEENAKKKLYCDLRARLLGTLGRWTGAGRAGRAWGARAGVGVGRWAARAQARGALERAGARQQAR